MQETQPFSIIPGFKKLAMVLGWKKLYFHDFIKMAN